MPKFLENKLKNEYPNNPHAVYGTMNKIGAMHGNKETAKGVAMERKHERDMKKGKTVARHTSKSNRGAEKPKAGSGMAYSKGKGIFGVPHDIANRDGHSAAGHEKRGHDKPVHGKGGHPGEGHKGHDAGNAGHFRDGHGKAMDHQRDGHDGIHDGGHLKRHTFHNIRHERHSQKMSCS